MNGIRVAFEGKVSFDPELRYTQAGKALCNVGVGVADGRGGVDWLRVALWEDLAERMYQELGKGDRVYVEGTLTLRQWTGQDGEQRSGLNVSAWKCEILGAVGRRAERPEPAARPASDDERGDGRAVDLAATEPSDDLATRRERIAAAAAEGTERAATRARRGRR